MKVDMMVQRFIAVLLMVALVGLVRAEDVKEVVVASAKGLKGIKAKKITWKKDSAKMVKIPTIAFKQVKTFNRIGEPIVKTVKVDRPDSIPFYMDVTEVTVGQFKKFLKSTGYQFDGDLWGGVYEYSPADKHPMVYATWYDATAYAKWVGKRLPTEAEWEFAARGGLVGKEFSWGNDESVAREYANYNGTGGKDKWEFTAPVGSFKPNGYGIFDMPGNVWEWCQDWSDSDKRFKELRGGSWVFSTNILRLDSRICTTRFPATRFNGVGFRCVSGSK